MTYQCFRCDEEHDSLSTMAYVIGTDMVVEQVKTRPAEVRHTPQTRGIRNKVAQGHGLTDLQADMALARGDKGLLRKVDNEGNTVFDHTDLGPDAFDVTPTMNPNRPEEAEEVVKVEMVTETVEVQKTGLVCKGCIEDSDTVIWGGP